MKVLVAGAAGALGRPTVEQLVAAGHEVTGTTRSPRRAGAIEELGARPVVVDVFDRDVLTEAVVAARPDAVIHQLTDLSRPVRPRHLAEDLAPNNRIRRDGTANLVAAARAAGTRTLVAQSIAFVYAPEGGWVKSEDDRLWDDAYRAWRETVEGVRALERAVLGEEGVRGVVLRYGVIYGPRTALAPGGELADMVAKRRFPIIGGGEARFSFVHVDDAARAAVLALDRGEGIYNVVDDEPAAVAEWLPSFAESLGARPPRRIPAFVARLAAGRWAIEVGTRQRGASNAKAKRELGWEPRYASWREGFRAQASEPAAASAHSIASR